MQKFNKNIIISVYTCFSLIILGFGTFGIREFGEFERGRASRDWHKTEGTVTKSHAKNSNREGSSSTMSTPFRGGRFSHVAV